MILKIPELKKYPETREPLEQLEDALRRSFILVNSCQDRSYFYLLAMGWNIVYQFRRAQTEIDQYLKIIPLITLVDNARVRERIEMIEKDQREYTLDDEDRKVQDVILKPDPSRKEAVALKKTLSCSYPNLHINEAIRKENEKLQLELQRSQANLDVGQCEDTVTTTTLRVTRNWQLQETPLQVSSRKDLLSSKGSHLSDEWHSDLLGCFSEPLLCIKTFFFPCGTFSQIASVANNRHISSAEACNDLMAYSLILSCCCYTCCIRRKLRKTLNITGGLFDDFLSHLMCCCCALVQEWREVKIRGVEGHEKTKTSPPPFQYMES
ncbi:Protein MID1-COMPLEMENTING ACTIVITY 1 [Forsythia ovata]|uniref:Protein MID1-COMPLEMENTING ACTIVITY 1 n=1 Tax=Forsythia ovata TaxID=205694 RepID=A0ABD1U5W4_9LAMI